MTDRDRLVQDVDCEATLSFAEPDFLPISALAQRRNCSGAQVAKMQIPEAAPNGTAAIQWYVKQPPAQREF